jgi:3-oxo-5-alpha-steroid 4-dehydrogenase 1
MGWMISDSVLPLISLLDGEGMEAKEKMFHTLVCYIVLASMAIALVALLLGAYAAYGRYSEAGWGPLVPVRLGWVVQELPVCAWGYWMFSTKELDPYENKTAAILAVMILIHYVNRTLVFPFRLRTAKPTPFGLVLLAYLFCSCNGYIQFIYLARYSNYENEYEYFSKRFVLGTCLFSLGFMINNHSDTILMNLRKPGDKGYYIPRGGMFELVSGANFLGEIIEWTGFAIAANSLPAWVFAIGTFCNLAPRASQHHQWYLKKFENYPKNRRAIIPFLW